MRAVAVSVWIFINLVFVGMCGYAYLLWTQYWRYVERQASPARAIGYSASGGSAPGAPVYYYYSQHGVSAEASAGAASAGVASAGTAWQARGLDGAQPRLRPLARELDAASAAAAEGCGGDPAACAAAADLGFTLPPLDARQAAKVSSYKAQLVVQLRRVLLEEAGAFRASSDRYRVRFAGRRGTTAGRGARALTCELRAAAAAVRPLGPLEAPFLHPPPPAPTPGPLVARRARACAVVSNAGALAGAGLGPLIDQHDLVLRFNHAPTLNYERDVGSRTDIRIVNSQVVSKPEFDFLHSPLYEDVALLVWDPSNYSAALEEWFARPEFDFFPPFRAHRERHPGRSHHVLHPRSLWALWDFIQSHIPVRIRKNPPSSGFLGLALLLPHCAYVDLFEYVPSMRLTKRCHYWEAAEDLSCTFGVWHPLAAEKLLALALNVATDQVVYTTGFVRVLGYDTLRC